MSWKRVCKITDVPENTLKQFTVDNVTLLIANYGSGFRAILPLCPHMQEPLEESGVIVNCALTCTKHLWSWDLSSLDMLGETERPLQTYKVKLENGDILAVIDKEPLNEFEEEKNKKQHYFLSKPRPPAPKPQPPIAVVNENHRRNEFGRLRFRVWGD